MKKLVLIQMSLFLSLLMPAKIEVLDRVAIIVNDGVIMESQIQDLVETTRLRFLEQGAEAPPISSLLEEIKEQLIVKELQLQKGLEFGVRISDGELNQTFIQIAQNNGLTLEQFIKNIQDSGQNYEKIREEVREDMIIQRVQRGVVSNSINITDQEIEGFLATEEAVDQLTPELLVRQIQVNSIESAEEILQSLESGESFENLVSDKSINQNKNQGGLMPWRKINDMPSVFGGESFSEIAKAFSEDPGSGSNGGSLDWLPKGSTVAEFENVMINSELNEISDVFESEYGFHFLEVTGKRVEDITDALIEDRAYSVLFSRKFDEELENTLRTMRAEAFVEFKDLD